MLPAFRFSPLALLVAASLHAHADEPVALELNDVVVTASGFAQSAEDAPASVTVIDGEDELASSGDLRGTHEGSSGCVVSSTG